MGDPAFGTRNHEGRTGDMEAPPSSPCLHSSLIDLLSPTTRSQFLACYMKVAMLRLPSIRALPSPQSPAGTAWLVMIGPLGYQGARATLAFSWRVACSPSTAPPGTPRVEANFENFHNGEVAVTTHERPIPARASILSQTPGLQWRPRGHGISFARGIWVARTSSRTPPSTRNFILGMKLLGERYEERCCHVRIGGTWTYQRLCLGTTGTPTTRKTAHL